MLIKNWTQLQRQFRRVDHKLINQLFYFIRIYCLSKGINCILTFFSFFKSHPNKLNVVLISNMKLISYKQYFNSFSPCIWWIFDTFIYSFIIPKFRRSLQTCIFCSILKIFNLFHWESGPPHIYWVKAGLLANQFFKNIPLSV